MFVFVEKGKPEYPCLDKNPGSKTRTKNKLNPHRAGNEPGLHWWECRRTLSPTRHPCSHVILVNNRFYCLFICTNGISGWIHNSVAAFLQTSLFLGFFSCQLGHFRFSWACIGKEKMAVSHFFFFDNVRSKLGPCLWLVTEALARIWVRGKFKIKK